MENQEDVSIINSSLPDNSFEITSTETEPLDQSNFYVEESIEVVSAEDSVICIEEDEMSEELQHNNDVPLNISSTSLPVTIPFTSGDLESSSVSHSNDDDDFCIVYEKKASPSEVQILENYISPNSQAKKKHRKSQIPRPSNQSEYNNSSSTTVQANVSLDDSISILQENPHITVTQTQSQNIDLNRVQQFAAESTSSTSDPFSYLVSGSNSVLEGDSHMPVTKYQYQAIVLNRMQQLEAESIEKKKRKIECGVCFDGPDEIEAGGRILVSTVCGHIYCSDCIKLAIKNSRQCPQCRKKLTMKQYHALYV